MYTSHFPDTKVFIPVSRPKMALQWVGTYSIRRKIKRRIDWCTYFTRKVDSFGGNRDFYEIFKILENFQTFFSPKL